MKSFVIRDQDIRFDAQVFIGGENLSIQPASVRAPPGQRLPLLYVDSSLKNLSPHRFLFFSVYPKVFIPDIKVTQLLLSLKTKSHLYLMSFFK